MICWWLTCFNELPLVCFVCSGVSSSFSNGSPLLFAGNLTPANNNLAPTIFSVLHISGLQAQHGETGVEKRYETNDVRNARVIFSKHAPAHTCISVILTASCLTSRIWIGDTARWLECDCCQKNRSAVVRMMSSHDTAVAAANAINQCPETDTTTSVVDFEIICFFVTPGATFTALRHRRHRAYPPPSQAIETRLWLSVRSSYDVEVGLAVVTQARYCSGVGGRRGTAAAATTTARVHIIIIILITDGMTIALIYISPHTSHTCNPRRFSTSPVVFIYLFVDIFAMSSQTSRRFSSPSPVAYSRRAASIQIRPMPVLKVWLQMKGEKHPSVVGIRIQ